MPFVLIQINFGTVGSINASIKLESEAEIPNETIFDFIETTHLKINQELSTIKGMKHSSRIDAIDSIFYGRGLTDVVIIINLNLNSFYVEYTNDVKRKCMDALRKVSIIGLNELTFYSDVFYDPHEHKSFKLTEFNILKLRVTNLGKLNTAERILEVS